jgi:tRNA(fMet)-specific endonuclease VapC
MAFLLDTNICIYIIKKKPQSVIERLSNFSANEIGVSSITVAELEYGARKSAFPERNFVALQQFLSPFNLYPFDNTAAAEYGLIRADLETKGQPIGALDFLIAAHAKSLGLILVTNNEKEFSRVDGLRIENWVTF